MIDCLWPTDVTIMQYDTIWYLVTDVAKNMGVGFLYGAYIPGKDFELILTVKIETRHPAGGLFSSEFPAICNHCVVMVAWNCKTWKLCEQFCVFLEKQPLRVKFSKFCNTSFHCLSDKRCSDQILWNLSDGKSVKSCIIYLIKNRISPASQTVTTVQIVPKICQGSTQQCAHSTPDFIQVG